MLLPPPLESLRFLEAAARHRGFARAGAGLSGEAVLDVPTTRGLVERLRTEGLLRRLCGWETAGGVPSEATFSRAFAEFAASDLPGRLHEALLDRGAGERTAQGRVWRAAPERVRGPGKVWCHLMFGILALTVEQLMRLTL